MTRTFAILLPLLVAGCIASGSVSGPPADSIFNTGPLSGKYAGTDAGYLVVTIAAQTDTLYDDYWIYFRRKDRSADNQIWWGQQNPVDQRKLDIKNDKEEGMVDVRRLPPGDYEIFNFQVHRNAGYLQTWWGSKQDFSIPFSIIAGRATYVGELMAGGLKARKDFLARDRHSAPISCSPINRIATCQSRNKKSQGSERSSARSSTQPLLPIR
jgi:hypothetical protein